MTRHLIISAKCSDLFSATFKTDTHDVDYDGYVCHDLGIGGGDYVELTIDVDTGKIIGFDSKAAAKAFDSYLPEVEEDDAPVEKKLDGFPLGFKMAGDATYGMAPLFISDGIEKKDVVENNKILDDHGFPVRPIYKGWVEYDPEDPASRFKHPKGTPVILETSFWFRDQVLGDSDGGNHAKYLNKIREVVSKGLAEPEFYTKDTKYDFVSDLVTLYFKDEAERDRFAQEYCDLREEDEQEAL